MGNEFVEAYREAQSPFGVPGIEYRRGKTKTAVPYPYRVVLYKGGKAVGEPKLFAKRKEAEDWGARQVDSYDDVSVEQFAPLSNKWSPLEESCREAFSGIKVVSAKKRGGTLEVTFTDSSGDGNWQVNYTPEFGDWGPAMQEEIREKLSSSEKTTLLEQLKKMGKL